VCSKEICFKESYCKKFCVKEVYFTEIYYYFLPLILRINQNIKEIISSLFEFFLKCEIDSPLDLLIVFQLSFLYLNYPTGNACVPADYSPHCYMLLEASTCQSLKMYYM
jgi:hypothetical protein